MVIIGKVLENHHFSRLLQSKCYQQYITMAHNTHVFGKHIIVSFCLVKLQLRTKIVVTRSFSHISLHRLLLRGMFAQVCIQIFSCAYTMSGFVNVLCGQILLKRMQNERQFQTFSMQIKIKMSRI